MRTPSLIQYGIVGTHAEMLSGQVEERPGLITTLCTFLTTTQGPQRTAQVLVPKSFQASCRRGASVIERNCIMHHSPATYHHKLQIFKDVDVLSHTVPRPSVVENHLSHYDSMTPHIDSMAVIPVRIREVEHSTRIFRGFSHHFRCHHSLLVDRRHHAGTVGRWHPSTKGIEC